MTDRSRSRGRHRDGGNTQLYRLAAQQAEVRELIDRTVAAGVHPLFLVEEEYRLTLLAAEVAFVDDFIHRVTDPRDGWAPMWAQAHHGAAANDERSKT